MARKGDLSIWTFFGACSSVVLEELVIVLAVGIKWKDLYKNCGVSLTSWVHIWPNSWDRDKLAVMISAIAE